MAKHELTPDEKARLDKMDVDAEKARAYFEQRVKEASLDVDTLHFVADFFTANWLSIGYKRLAKIAMSWKNLGE